MTTITKEWLQQTIAEFENTRDDIPFGLSDDDAKILIVLKQTLASLTAEPVLYAAEETLAYAKMGELHLVCLSEPMGDAVIPLYAAPPAPVVPEEMPKGLAGQIVSLLAHNIGDKLLAQKIWNACRATMLQGAEPVSQTYTLPELIEGMEVSIDVSTCGADAGNRYFGTVTEVSELYTAKNGYILLVQDAEPNFDVNGNSPVSPGGWISYSERMPDDGQHVIILCDGAFVLYAQYRDGEFFDVVRNGEEFFETHSRNVTDWMPLPEPPQEEK